MATWWKAETYNAWKIVPVEVTDETRCFIRINSQRTAKTGQYENYFPTFREAKDFLLAKFSLERSACMGVLERVQEKIRDVIRMEEPDV
jgi:hypothetical protein